MRFMFHVEHLKVIFISVNVSRETQKWLKI